MENPTILSPDPEVEEELKDRNVKLASEEPRFQPIQEKPRNWTADSYGLSAPYRDQKLNRLLKMVKNMHGDQIAAVDDAIKDGRLNLPILTLSKLQSVPYLVNHYVVNAVDWVRKDVNRAKSVNGFPRLLILDLDKLDHAEIAKKPKFERRAIRTERNDAEADNADAKRNDTKIDGWIREARKQGHEKFYLPHQFDRRGRVYHVQTCGHLQHRCTASNVLSRQ